MKLKVPLEVISMALPDTVNRIPNRYLLPINLSVMEKPFSGTSSRVIIVLTDYYIYRLESIAQFRRGESYCETVGKVKVIS